MLKMVPASLTYPKIICGTPSWSNIKWCWMKISSKGCFVPPLEIKTPKIHSQKQVGKYKEKSTRTISQKMVSQKTEHHCPHRGGSNFECILSMTWAYKQNGLTTLESGNWPDGPTLGSLMDTPGGGLKRPPLIVNYPGTWTK